MEFFKTPPDYIVLHCTDTEPKMSISVDWIRQMHLSRGFEDIGYHFLIMPDGEIFVGRSLEYVGAHCIGLNSRSIGIAYVGGRIGSAYKDTRTRLQKMAICQTIANLLRTYPSIKYLVGHNEWSNKLCPCFDVQEELRVWFNEIKYEIQKLRP